jgi:hypothetical protein
MLITENMQHAVYDEANDLFAQRNASGTRVRAGNLGGDVHVTDDGIAGSLAREAEGNHVGGARVTQIIAIERGNPAPAEERHREQGVANPFGAKCRTDDAREAGASHWHAHAVDGNVHG